jgi:hypothetical protein
MNLSDRVEQFVKSYLRPACSDINLWRSLGNLLNELLIAQKSLIDCLVIALLVTQALSVFEKLSVKPAGLSCRVSQLSQN